MTGQTQASIQVARLQSHTFEVINTVEINQEAMIYCNTWVHHKHSSKARVGKIAKAMKRQRPSSVAEQCRDHKRAQWAKALANKANHVFDSQEPVGQEKHLH